MLRTDLLTQTVRSISSLQLADMKESIIYKPGVSVRLEERNVNYARESDKKAMIYKPKICILVFMCCRMLVVKEIIGEHDEGRSSDEIASARSITKPMLEACTAMGQGSR